MSEPSVDMYVRTVDWSDVMVNVASDLFDVVVGEGLRVGCVKLSSKLVYQLF